MRTSAFLEARMRMRCIRSGCDDISAKRSRGTSSEFHSDRMRTGHFPRIPAVPENNRSITMRKSHQFGVPHLREQEIFLEVFLFKRVRDSWFLDDVYWKFVIRKLLPNLTYDTFVIDVPRWIPARARGCESTGFPSKLSAQIYLDNYYYYRCKNMRDRNQKLSRRWEHARSTYVYTGCAKFVNLLFKHRLLDEIKIKYL